LFLPGVAHDLSFRPEKLDCDFLGERDLGRELPEPNEAKHGEQGSETTAHHRQNPRGPVLP
jgi:hypothetical protein